MALIRSLLLAALLLGLSSCISRPEWHSERMLGSTSPAAGSKIYISPFTPLMAPEATANAIFDRFIDAFNAAAPQSGLEGVILKTPEEELDPAWLLARYRITGEIYSYLEDVGCCSSELRVSARVQLFQPEKTEAIVRITVPYETFFDHDRSTLVAEKARLTEVVAERLKTALLQELAR